jgi:hypothetical protein
MCLCTAMVVNVRILFPGLRTSDINNVADNEDHMILISG